MLIEMQIHFFQRTRVAFAGLLAAMAVALGGCGGGNGAALTEAETEEITRLRQANVDLQKFRVDPQELARLRRDNEELVKLREQVQALDQLRKENGELRAQLAARPAPKSLLRPPGGAR